MNGYWTLTFSLAFGWAVLQGIHAKRDDKLHRSLRQCSVEACAERDPKGLYKKASAGQIKNLTGPQNLYEEPVNSDLILDREKLTVAEGVEAIESKLPELNLV